MKKIIAEWPSEPRTKTAGLVALFYAGALTFMVAAQLFSFEKFITLMEQYFSSGRGVATLSVVLAVLAIPALLKMKLSKAFRCFSLISGLLFAALWIFLGVNILAAGGDNAALVGASVTLEPGLWSLLVSFGLLILAVWSTWGLWPSGGKLESRKK